MSVTALNTPREVFNTTTSPPCARLVLLAFLSCTVMLDVVTPFARILVGDALITELPACGARMTVTAAGVPIAAPFAVPVMFAVPAVVPAVNVAV